MEKTRSGWRTFGLIAGIGCLSMIAIVVGGLVIATVWARATLKSYGDPDPRPVDRRIALPAPVPAEADGEKPASGDAIRKVPMRLTLDLQEGDFTIKPGQPGSEIQIEGEYAPGWYELTDTRDTDPATGASRATVRFRSKVPGWARIVGGFGAADPDRPRLTVTIPRGAPFDLTLQMNIGRSEVDLGGLTLGEVSINATMGEHRIDFHEPVAEAIRELRFNTSMGNVILENLGNARAESINAHGTMGNVTASLGGVWAPGEEADVRFEQSMGELTVRVPSNIRVDADVRSSQGESSKAPVIKQPDDPKAPALRLRVTTSMGEARVVQY
jgi:hypothetical protein